MENRVFPVSYTHLDVYKRQVEGHIKRGAYVASHLHLNLTYLLEADDRQELTIKADENSDVRWIYISELDKCVSEPWMMKWVYKKLMKL